MTLKPEADFKGAAGNGLIEPTSIFFKKKY
jgi:hypothetical protein